MSLLIKALKQAERQHATNADAAATPQDTTDATLALINAAGTATAAMPPRKAAAPAPQASTTTLTPMQTLSMESPALEFAPLDETKAPPRPTAHTAAPNPASDPTSAAAFAPTPAPHAASVRPAAQRVQQRAQTARTSMSTAMRWGLIGGVAASVLIGMFAYQWFSMPSYSAAVQAPVEPAAADATPPAAPAPTAQAQKNTAPVIASATTPVAPRPRAAANTGTAPKPAAPAAPTAEQKPTANAEPVSTSSGVGSAVRFLRTEPQSEQLMRTLQEAYAALRANNFETARQKYEQALSIDRNHIDAWLGMATLAVKANDPVLAQRYYQRALEIDPNDAAARSGLMNLRASGDAAAEESQLRSLLAHNAQQPAVHFALGNLLAAQSRWNEAQQAYFNALNGDPAQPDYAFNLAVSLDRMRQPQLAVQFYRKALELAQRAPARFDRAAVSARVNALVNTAAAAAAATGAASN